MMTKLFAAYCTAIVTTLAAFNYNGYPVTSYFGGSQTADKSVNRYHK